MKQNYKGSSKGCVCVCGEEWGVGVVVEADQTSLVIMNVMYRVTVYHG